MNRLVPSSWRLFFQKTLVRLMRQNGDFARLHARIATRFFMVAVSASALKCLCCPFILAAVFPKNFSTPDEAKRRFRETSCPNSHQIFHGGGVGVGVEMSVFWAQIPVSFGGHAPIPPLTQEDATLTATSVNTTMFHLTWSTCASVGCQTPEMALQAY